MGIIGQKGWMNMKRWKRIAALLLAISMLLCLCACGEQNGGTGSESPDPQNTEQDTSEPAKPADTSAPSGTEEPAGTEEPSVSTDINTDPAVQTLALQKQMYGLYEWEDDTLLAQSRFSHVTLCSEDAAKYPELAETLEQTAGMVKRSMEDEFDNICAFVQEGWGGARDTTSVSTLDVQVRRADSVVLSILTDSFADFGEIYGIRAMNGTTYNTQTGQKLELSDVIKDMGPIPALVEQELNSHMWAGDFSYDGVVADYFRDTPEDGISWTLDYNGVTFYFGEGDLAQEGFGSMTATVSFAQHPELFEEKYMAVPDAYMVELPLDYSFFTDLDDNGDLEELNVTGWYDSDMGMYSDFGIYTDADGYYHYEEFAADSYAPYYVKTAAGGHYLYLFCEQLEGYGPWFVLKVMDVSGGRFTGVGTMNVGPAYIPDDIYLIPTDPENFYLDDFDSMVQDMMAFAVGSMGLPEPK